MTFNRDLCILLVEKHGRALKNKNAYEIVNLILRAGWPEIPADAKVEVLFCYLPWEYDETTIFTRHAFVVVNDELVEPFKFAEIDFKCNPDFVTIAKLTQKEYYDLFLEEKDWPLRRVLMKDEVRAFNARRVGPSLNNYDLVPLIRLIAGDDTAKATQLFNNVMLGDGLLPEVE